MKSFEVQRKEYLEKLKQYPEYVVKASKITRYKEDLEDFLFPKNEEDLNLANAYITFWQDCNILEANILLGAVQEVDLEDSILIKFLMSIINDDNDEIKSYTNDNDIFAKILYQMTIGCKKQQEKISKIIFDKCNVNIYIVFDLISFSGKFINTMIKVNEIANKIIDSDRIIAIAMYYHGLCANGIKKNSDSKNNQFSVDNINFGKQK